MMENYKLSIVGFLLVLFSFVVTKHLPENDDVITMDTLASEIAELRRNIVSLENRITYLEQNNNSTGEFEEIPNVRTKRATRRYKRHVVAFQATLNKGKITVGHKVPIKYDTITTNKGNAYNSKTGIFTAPVTGIYTFSTNIVADEGHLIEACIQDGDNVKASAISDHRNTPGILDQGNTVAIMQLQRGSQVYVSVHYLTNGEHVIQGLGRSGFSGHLIRAL